MKEDLISRDPKYTVCQISEITGLTKHAIRYYEDKKLVPFASRDKNGKRLFSDYDIEWLKVVHCLRISGLPIFEVQHYIELCLKGDQTIPERAEIIFKQEEEMIQKIEQFNEQLKIIRMKKKYYEVLLSKVGKDTMNPVHGKDTMNPVYGRNIRINWSRLRTLKIRTAV